MLISSRNTWKHEGMKKQGLQGLVIHREADATGGEAAVLLSHLDPGMDSISLS